MDGDWTVTALFEPLMVLLAVVIVEEYIFELWARCSVWPGAQRSSFHVACPVQFQPTMQLSCVYRASIMCSWLNMLFNC